MALAPWPSKESAGQRPQSRSIERFGQSETQDGLEAAIDPASMSKDDLHHPKTKRSGSLPCACMPWRAFDYACCCSPSSRSWRQCPSSLVAHVMHDVTVTSKRPSTHMLRRSGSVDRFEFEAAMCGFSIVTDDNNGPSTGRPQSTARQQRRPMASSRHGDGGGATRVVTVAAIQMAVRCVCMFICGRELLEVCLQAGYVCAQPSLSPTYTTC